MDDATHQAWSRCFALQRVALKAALREVTELMREVAALTRAEHAAIVQRDAALARATAAEGLVERALWYLPPGTPLRMEMEALGRALRGKEPG